MKNKIFVGIALLILIGLSINGVYSDTKTNCGGKCSIGNNCEANAYWYQKAVCNIGLLNHNCYAECSTDCFRSYCSESGGTKLDAYCEAQSGRCMYWNTDLITATKFQTDELISIQLEDSGESLDETTSKVGCYKLITSKGTICPSGVDACCEGSLECRLNFDGGYVCCDPATKAALDIDTVMNSATYMKCKPEGIDYYVGTPFCNSGGNWECFADGYPPEGRFQVEKTVEPRSVRWIRIKWVNDEASQETSILMQYSLGGCGAFKSCDTSGSCTIGDSGKYNTVCLQAVLKTEDSKKTPALAEVELISEPRLVTVTQQDVEKKCAEQFNAERTIIMNIFPYGATGAGFQFCADTETCMTDPVDVAAVAVLNSMDYGEPDETNNWATCKPGFCLKVRS